MAKQIWYPEEGDVVNLKDGRSGAVTDESPISQDEGDWTAQVEVTEDSDGNELEDDDRETLEDLPISYNEQKRAWEEDES